MFNLDHTKQKKIYQIYADRVKILAPSQEAIEIRTPRTLGLEHDGNGDAADSDDDYVKCFNTTSATSQAHVPSASSLTASETSPAEPAPKQAKVPTASSATTSETSLAEPAPKQAKASPLSRHAAGKARATDKMNID